MRGAGAGVAGAGDSGAWGAPTVDDGRPPGGGAAGAGAGRAARPARAGVGVGAPVRPRAGGRRSGRALPPHPGPPRAPPGLPGPPGGTAALLGRILRGVPEGSPAGRQARVAGTGASGPRSGEWAPSRPPPPLSRRRPPPPIPVIVEFISPPPLRSGRAGRGGAGGLAGVGWGEGVVKSQVQPRPGKFPFRPELGAGLLSGSPGPSARDPRGRGGEHSAILKLFASSCPWKVLRPCTPRPLPGEPFQGCRLQPLPREPPRLGRGPARPVCKSFPGICLSLLVSDWACCSGKGGGKFRWYFYGAGFPNRFFSPHPGNRGCYVQIEHPPSSHPWLLWVSSPLFWTALLRERGRER